MEAKLQAAFSRILVLEVALATCHVGTPVSQDPVQAHHFTAIQVPTDMVDRVQAITVGLIWHIYCNFCAGVPHHFAAQAAASCGKQIRKAAKIPLAAANEAKHSFETGATHRWTDTERTHIQDIRGQMSSTAVQSSYGTQHSPQQPQVWTDSEAGHFEELPIPPPPPIPIIHRDLEDFIISMQVFATGQSDFPTPEGAR